MNRQDHNISNSGKRWMKHARHFGAVASSDGPHAIASGLGSDSDFDTNSLTSEGLVALIRTSPREFLGLTDAPLASRPVVLDGSPVDLSIWTLTSALTLSLVTGRPFQIHNFRASAPDPGLRLEELGLIKAAATLCEAKLEGNSAGSRRLSFRPSECLPRDLSIDLGTAGSASLLIQTLHLPLALKARRASRLTVLGGIFPGDGPRFAVLDETWRGQMARVGAHVALAMPAVDKIEAWIEPAGLRPVNWTTRGRLLKLRGFVRPGNLGGEVAERLKGLVESRLRFEGFKAEIEIIAPEGTSSGTSIQLTATHDDGVKGPGSATFVAVVEPGTAPEKAANDTLEAFLRFERIADAAIDPQSAGPLLLALALAEGRSEFTVSEVTRPLRATLETLRAFLPDRVITILEGEGGTSAARVAVSLK